MRREAGLSSVTKREPMTMSAFVSSMVRTMEEMYEGICYPSASNWMAASYPFRRAYFMPA